jgi:hypothetical protein
MNKQFVGEQISVSFDRDFVLEKDPPCPITIQWREQTIKIVKLISQWRDFSRSGSSEKNMRPKHAERAAKKGSWGVGKIYFEILDENDNVLVIYYDRAPKGSAHRLGQWTLLSISEQDAQK